MLYVFIGRDAPGSLARRIAARPRHVERIDRLVEAGRLILAGPMPAIDAPDPGPAGFTGSVIVAEFESLAAAKSWIAADPYVIEGVYAEVEVQPFLKTKP